MEVRDSFFDSIYDCDRILHAIAGFTRSAAMAYYNQDYLRQKPSCPVLLLMLLPDLQDKFKSWKWVLLSGALLCSKSRYTH
ncbi:MAG: hypothetical protein GX089_09245 [Fibrobacter sp.]|nr:hypothetical protein [Fibrobacter sp.]